ncbi:MAG: GMC family oxidoreductase [Acidobacteria bacterium]|nr:GMC family oxidoreductase [Acidobacteriota bacterium]MDA1235479.1 GMC family oxidoreductase [Acidobacteriota bacterium]
MQIIQSGEALDVVVVGSGATGGWMAKHLSEAGLKVALLEAGPKVTPAEFTEHQQPYDWRYRGASPEVARNRPVQSMKYACREPNHKWFVDDIENPYTTPADKPFQWTRGRQLGGRSLTWGRQSYRFSPMDLAPASHDGFGEDWPVTYEELVPYYEKVERYVGISGSAEGLAQLPDSIMQPPMGMNCGEKHLQSSIQQKLGRRVTIGRVAVLTKDLNGRKACHYCGPCEQGCATFSYFSSPWTTVADALKSGNCTLVTDAVVSHIETDPNTGLARGVAYFDRVSRQPRELRAKAIALCASSLESTRILLNSGEGFCNSSGALGRYLMDHISGGATGKLPIREESKWLGAPRRPNGLYIPRFINLDRPHTNGMIRGYGYQGGHGSSYGSPSAIAARPGFGASFKNSIHESDDWYSARLRSFGECLPRWDNHVALDPEVRDAWGIPALCISASWSDNELQLSRHSTEQAKEMLHAAGAEDIREIYERPYAPGGTTHEVGTARMGKDPRKSVLNEWNQAHDVKNIFCTDGAAFTSVACQNPTLTMMALTVRTGDHIIERARRGELV